MKAMTQTTTTRGGFPGVVKIAASAAMVLGGLTFAVAQDPGQGQQQQQPAQQPGFGGQAGGGQGGPDGGQGGRRGRGMPFVMGTVSAVDAQTGRIAIQPQFGVGPPGGPGGGGEGGGAQTMTVQLTQSTQMVTQATVRVGDLKVGDRVQVQGVPTGISAVSLTAGEPPAFLPGAGGGGGGQGGGQSGAGGDGTAAARNGGAGAGGSGGATASATGQVTSLEPLTVALGGGVSLSIQVTANTRVTRIGATTLDALKAGDRLMVAGQAGADGTFTATGVGVNLEMGDRFGGSRGGWFGGGDRGGGRGRGGPGVPPPQNP